MSKDEFEEKVEDVEETEEDSAAATDASEDTSSESTAEPEESGESGESEDIKYMRLAADFQNYKRRVEKEKSDIYSYANEKIALDLLDVLDNFERGIEHIEDEGTQLIIKQFRDVLAKHGIEEIESLGEDFDPNYHHAVVMEPSKEYKSGKITEVMQKGYCLKDRVIRPSMVKVAE